mmetsp:Transcript_106802/g.278892  ORF Transcript_106802/g.278892 Transcript_106802/m.278892 type:complete len:282 (-) Transcript_106802:1882-2727(-)
MLARRCADCPRGDQTGARGCDPPAWGFDDACRRRVAGRRRAQRGHGGPHRRADPPQVPVRRVRQDDPLWDHDQVGRELLHSAADRRPNGDRPGPGRHPGRSCAGECVGFRAEDHGRGERHHRPGRPRRHLSSSRPGVRSRWVPSRRAQQDAAHSPVRLDCRGACCVAARAAGDHGDRRLPHGHPPQCHRDAHVRVAGHRVHGRALLRQDRHADYRNDEHQPGSDMASVRCGFPGARLAERPPWIFQDLRAEDAAGAAAHGAAQRQQGQAGRCHRRRCAPRV